MAHPVRYRRVGDTEWHRGDGINVSRAGILFSPTTALSVTTRVEVYFTLPGRIPGEQEVSVHCECRVVRVDQVTMHGVVAAAAIDTYQLQRLPAG
jgi:hypothetical protein